MVSDGQPRGYKKRMSFSEHDDSGHHGRGHFPSTRLRRLRYLPAMRQLVQQTVLSPANLVLPLFVRAGHNERLPIASMPGHCQLSPDLLADEVRAAAAAGLGGVILFGIPAEKDALGSDSYSDAGIIQR